MSIDDLVKALDLSESCQVNQRVPKKLLLENGAPTAADKRRINEGIEEIHWLAAMKPNTIGVPDFSDDIREYLEIALLLVALRPDAKAGRLAELIHRAIPYPLFLIMSQGEQTVLSLAHKRRAQNEEGKFVLDGDVVEVTVSGKAPLTAELISRFLEAMALRNQSRSNLMLLYQGWIDTFIALQASLLTGTFCQAATKEAANDRREALQRCRELETKIAVLKNAATKEKQINRQVEFNLELKRLQAAQAAVLIKL